jgi:hypothetical protein
MVRTKLDQLKQEIQHYIGLPYMINIIRDGRIIKERFMGAKGYWKDIEKETKRLAKENNVNINKLSSQRLYNFQKKHKIGIDCSGLASQLLIYYGKLLGKKITINPRRTSAEMLTSESLSTKINDPDNIQTGDLIRQKNGHHVLFIIEKKGKIIDYVDSSFWGRGVKYGQIDLNDPMFDNQGIYRLKSLFLN